MKEQTSGKKENNVESAFRKVFSFRALFSQLPAGISENWQSISLLPSCSDPLQAAFALVTLVRWANLSYLH